MENIIKETISNLTAFLSSNINEINVVKQEDEIYYVNIKIEDENEQRSLIGRDSNNLKAIEALSKLILGQKLGDRVSMFLDINGFRKKQEDSVKKMASEAVEKVRVEKTPYKLAPMSPYFRRIVHLYLTGEEFSDIATESVGIEPMRRVMVKLKGE
jgi:spoIIIJ-associated protein